VDLFAATAQVRLWPLAKFGGNGDFNRFWTKADIKRILRAQSAINRS
jgi:hypothetical protein